MRVLSSELSFLVVNGLLINQHVFLSKRMQTSPLYEQTFCNIAFLLLKEFLSLPEK